jgi:hypothetical protein
MICSVVSAALMGTKAIRKDRKITIPQIVIFLFDKIMFPSFFDLVGDFYFEMEKLRGPPKGMKESSLGGFILDTLGNPIS